MVGASKGLQLASLAGITTAMFIQNPDTNGMSWEGVTTLQSLEIEKFHHNLGLIGVNISSIRYCVEDGRLFSNLGTIWVNMNWTQLRSCATEVIPLHNETGFKLTQMDYLNHTIDDSVEWQEIQNLHQSILVHSNIVDSSFESSSVRFDAVPLSKAQ